MSQRIVIMAGGTGGHIFPALAVAKYLKQQGWMVSWVGTKRGMESRVIPENNIEIDWLSVGGIRGKGLTAKINSLWQLINSFAQVFSIFRLRKPDVVLGFGGYVAGPGGLMAKLMGIPLVIHEQNRVPGTTNRLLANKANKIMEAFPESFPKHKKAVFTGNPLRTDFLNVAKKEFWTKADARAFRILVVGGSQGAKILNDVIPGTVKQLSNVEVRHQTGTAAFEQVAKKYVELSINAEVVAFINDIAAAYQWADMVICRAGAMTISEVAAVGLPAVFIPLPHAIDDHQTANAKYLTEAGAGILLAQNDLNESSLLTAINEIKQSLNEMSMASKNKAKLDATEVVADICAKEAKK
ncbi:MAG: undecaprenyldiphospho-muramoylpentapeptide beta-N-acetylglucosaminyltransferase [Methylococcales bacterium]|nr:undecaprenyldiphospho-muramoylpentapeptide beta-N-acetylglucosaminyltransferase [Methylococcales bacterium]